MGRLVTFSGWFGVFVGLWACFGEGFVDDADVYAEVGGDGSDGLATFASGEDGGAFVVVDDGASTPDTAVPAGGF